MSKKCPLCGNIKTGEGLFCPDCTDTLNNEYEVDMPTSETSEESLVPNSEENIESKENLEDASPLDSYENEEEAPQVDDAEPDETDEPEVEEYTVERRVKVAPAPNFDKKAWKKRRKDKLSGTDKSYYELSKEGKSNKVLAIIVSIVVLLGVLAAGLYIYNKDVKTTNLERSQWEAAQRENTIDSYLTYMDEYPQGTFSDEAYENMLVLKNRETVAWENLMTSENTIEFTGFLEQYPGSPYRGMVRNRLDSLMWQSSLKENSTEAYSNYINSVTSHEIEGDYIGEAEKRFKMLNQSTPLDEEVFEQLKKVVDGFFVGISTLSHEALSENIAPTIVRYNNDTNLSSDQMIGKLMLQAAKENAESLRLEAEVANLKYERLHNGTYEVNVPLQKIFEENGGGVNQIKGYIVHLKLDADFKIYSYYETKPYTGAP